MKADMLFKLFVPITKIDEERREVIGRATVEELDAQGEIIEYAGSKRAFEAWTKKFEKATGGKSLGNIREMHQNVAAGKAIAWDAEDDAKAIELASKVVDDAAWTKCREGVYTGYSIGGKATRQKKERRDGKLVNVVKDYVLNEVSLVDNPASPSSVFSMVKGNGDGFMPISMAKFREPGNGDEDPPDDTPIAKATRIIAKLQKGATVQKPAALDACVADLVAQGKDESTAFAICTAAQEKLGKDATAEQIMSEVKAGDTGPIANDGKHAIHLLSFEKAHFADPADVTHWLKRRGFAETEIAIHDHAMTSEQKPEAEFLDVPSDEGRAVWFGKGVTAIIKRLRIPTHRPLAYSARPAIIKLLGRIKKNMLSEGPSIFSAMRALDGVLSAIDTEIGSAMFDPNAEMPDEEKSAVADLTEVATSLLEFMRGEFDQQLRAITGAGVVAAVPAAEEVLEQFVCLAQVLTPDQVKRLKKQEDDEEDEAEAADELVVNLGKIHEMGHALSTATFKMGAACAGGTCKQEDDDDKPPPPDDETDEEKQERERQEAEEEEKRRKAARAGKTPAGSSADLKKAAADVAKVLATVTQLDKAFAGFSKRLEKVEKLPSTIGRTPRTVEKTIGGGGGSGDDGAAERQADKLSKLAAETNDPVTKERLLKEAATALIKGIHASV